MSFAKPCVYCSKFVCRRKKKTTDIIIYEYTVLYIVTFIFVLTVAFCITLCCNTLHCDHVVCLLLFKKYYTFSSHLPDENVHFIFHKHHLCGVVFI